MFAVYFVQRGTTFDLGPSPGLRFGLFQTGNPNPLVQCSTFTYTTDVLSRTCYRGYPVFNTTQLAAAVGTNNSISAIGEFRYQTTGGTIARTPDVPFTVYRVLLSETILDHTTANFTVPSVGSNVTIAISSTSWLKPGMLLSIGAGAGSYTVVSVTDATHFVAQNNGGAGNASPGTNIVTGTTVGIAPSNVISTYPDPSVIEITTHKGAASGYAGLDSSSLLTAAQIPVDNKTIAVSGGQIASSAILATVSGSFTTPAVNGTISVAFNSTANFVVGQYVRLPVAGYYIVQSITSGTVAVLQNNGDPFNAASGVTIPSGTVVLPAQAATSGSGTPGQNAYTTVSTSFTVPPVGSTVSVNMGSTSWLAGSGYVVFITGGGYYAVSSITDPTHATLTNLGYAATNASPGATIPNGANISPGGLQGAASTATGANAYDATTASFTMPAAAASVNVTISNTSWLGVGQEVFIVGAGYFSVASITSPTNFSATNSNYPGAAAPGSTIASGAKVSPAGVIGPQGAGGSGLNAYTTLTSNFTQPAVNATVGIVVASTAWMATGQGIYIAGGGYYSISAIADLTHATVFNTGASGNAAPGATVTGSGTQMVSPAGVPGTTGASAYTTTTASFVTPAALGAVTVSVASTAFLIQNQNVFINGAGYYSVSLVVDSTHFVAINLGTTGNVTSGTSVAGGAGVGPAGATGPAINTSGGFNTASDAIATAAAPEVSLIATQTGGVLALKKLKPGSGGITLTDNGGTTGDILINAAGSGGGLTTADVGIEWQEDFCVSALGATRFNAVGNGVSITLGSTVGGTSGAGSAGTIVMPAGASFGNRSAIYDSSASSDGNHDHYFASNGVLDVRFRIWIPAVYSSTSNYSIMRLGIITDDGTGVIRNGLYFEYNYSQNSGNWIGTNASAGGITRHNSSTAVVAASWINLRLLTDSLWSNVTWYVNGVSIVTASSVSGLTNAAPVAAYNANAAGTTQNLYLDWVYLKYSCPRGTW